MSTDRDEPIAVADEAACWRFADFVLDERTLELRRGGGKIELPRKPFELLMFFVRNPGEVVTKDELFEAVWPGRIVSENSLTNAIRSLRQALGDEAQEMVKLAYGYGYRFTAKVTRDDLVAGTVNSPTATFHFAIGAPVPYRGGWTFEKSLGSGGFGEVWLATAAGPSAEKRLEKRVFKFARNAAGFSALKREITLFRLMKDALDQRDDLVQLIDWNIEHEPYFISQQWCQGGSLVQWAQDQGGIDKLPQDLRLDLVAQAADALAAAHSVGVLHKDLKPSNLLVQLGADGRPQVKLADFGSARLLQRNRLERMNITQLGLTQTVMDTLGGTPLYLAPELLAGYPPTIQSDVYALGVVLYQTLVGSFKRQLAPGWEREIDDELLREDIALAAAGNPDARLADAGQLATRLRTLPQRKIAREQERAEALRLAAVQRAADRTKARRGLAIALGLTMFLGLLATSALLWKSVRAERAAQAEAARASAISAFMTDDLLAAADPLIVGRRDVAVSDVLDAAASKLDERLSQQPRTRATLQRVIGSAYATLGDHDKAEKLLKAAIENLSASAGPANIETQTARLVLRDMYMNFGEFGRTVPLSAEAFRLEQAAGRPNPEIAYETEAANTIVGCWNQYSSEYLSRCEKLAEDAYRKVLTAMGPDKLATLHAGVYWGTTLIREQRFAEAVVPMEAAEKGLARLGDTIWLRQCRGLLSEAYSQTGRLAQALQRDREDQDFYETIFGPRARLSFVGRSRIASTTLAMGDEASGVEMMRSVWNDAQPAESMRPIDRAKMAYALTQVQLKSGRDLGAEAATQAMIVAMDTGNGRDRFWKLMLRDQLIDLQLSHKDTAAAERSARLNFDEAQPLFTRGEWLMGWIELRLAERLLARGDAAGHALAQKAAAALSEAVGPDHEMTRRAMAAASIT